MIKREVLEEFHKALFSAASGHGKGGQDLSQDDPNKTAPLPSVHLSIHACFGDYTAVLTQHLLGEDKTNLVQPPFHFNHEE